jgi:hypothetical protein
MENSLSRVQHHNNKKKDAGSNKAKKYKRVEQSTTERAKETDQNVTQSIKKPNIKIFSCFICAESRPYNTVFQNCQHRDICYKCILALRSLMHDNQCCICKTSSEKVIITCDDKIKNFDEYDSNTLISLNDCFPGVFCDHPIIEEDVKEMIKLKCWVCGQDNFQNIHQLKSHTSNEHSLYYCQLCLDNRKVFLKDQKLYKWKQLQSHIKYGEIDDKFGKINGHPICKFCNKRLYEDGDLFKHMYSAHETCFLCEKNGIQFEFYRDYPALENHFEKDHFACLERVCKEKHFVVFASEIELKTHTLKEHTMKQSNKKGKAKMNLDIFASSSGSPQTMQHQLQQRARRNLRVGNVDSSVIRFVGIAENDGYYNEGVNSGGVQQNMSNYPVPSKKRVDTPALNEEQQNNEVIHYVEPSTSLSRNAFTPSRPTSSQSSTSDSTNRMIQDNVKLKEKTALLVKRMKEAVSQEQFNLFRTLSANFQKGSLFATEYYSKFVEIFGEKTADELYPLLLETMPEQDPKKIDALKLARNAYHSKELGNPNEKPAKQEDSPKKKKDSSAKKKKQSKKCPTQIEAQPPPTWGPVVPQTAPKPVKKTLETEFPSLVAKSSSNNSGSSSKSKDTAGVWFNSRSKGQIYHINTESEPKTSSLPAVINGITIKKKK